MGGVFCLQYIKVQKKRADTRATPIKHDFKLIVCRWQQKHAEFIRKRKSDLPYSTLFKINSVNERI